jgi:arsenate reductase-like glutaredoxin family protein
MSFKDIKITGDIVIINGEKNEKDIMLFALSTCQWCKKGKKWLEDNNYHYKYVDVDFIPFEEKRILKRDLREFFNTMIRYPFLVVDGKDFYAGFNIDNWKEMLE